MRTRTGWLALLLVTAGMALAPTTGWAQGETYDVPQSDPAWNPLPLYSDRPDKGGFYAAAEFIFWRQNNPLKSEVIAQRGFVDFTGAATGITLDRTGEIVGGHPGAFVGSGAPALNTNEVGGPLTYQPGFLATVGWRFENGVAIDANWYHLFEAKYAATATLVPQNFQVGANQADSFLFSPVFDFPTEYAGPASKIFVLHERTNGTLVNRPDVTGALFGIWNGATNESEQFTQRFDQWDITARIPIFQDDCYRCYGLVGPQISWIWEGFKWRTVSVDITGNAGQDDVALYSTYLSNRMYGVHIGGGTEWVLCNTPAGTFSWSLDAQAALLIDFVAAEAKYERGDFLTSAHRRRNMYTIAPELEANASIWYYPLEGIQIRVGYNVMSFFNTISTPEPVDFNYGTDSPGYHHEFARFFDGLNAGIAFLF